MKKKVIWLLLFMFLLVLCGCKDSTVEKEFGKKEEQKMEGVRIVFEVLETEFTEEELEDTLYILQKRLEDCGQTEAKVYAKKGNRIYVDIPGWTDADATLKELGRAGEIFFILGTGNIELIGQDVENGAYQYAFTKSWEEIEAAGDIILDGSDIQYAKAGVITEYGVNEYIVSLELNERGKSKFAEATGAHIGEIIAIVYDGEIVSAPMVQQKLTDGRAQISGSFTWEEASNLATTMRVGALPLELREISRDIVEIK